MIHPLPARPFGTSGRRVSALGLGCWAIGGPFFRGDEPLGYGTTDDAESLRALRKALDLGVTLFDTSDFYGCGHSERLLSRALPALRDGLTIVTKFGYRCDESRRLVLGHRDLPKELPDAIDGSLSRLGATRIDVYLLHLRDYPLERVDDLIEALEHEVHRGRIGGYGWSTDDPERARAIARGPHCVAIEMAQNVIQGNRDLVSFTQERGLAALARSPLAMGILARSAAAILANPHRSDDIRSRFDRDDPRMRALDAKLDAIRAILTRDGRSLAQGALAALLARGPHVLPIPGFRTAQQVEENVRTLELPPLRSEDSAALEALVADLDLPPDPLTLRTRT